MSPDISFNHFNTVSAVGSSPTQGICETSKVLLAGVPGNDLCISLGQVNKLVRRHNKSCKDLLSHRIELLSC